MKTWIKTIKQNKKELCLNKTRNNDKASFEELI